MTPSVESRPLFGATRWSRVRVMSRVGKGPVEIRGPDTASPSIGPWRGALKPRPTTRHTLGAAAGAEAETLEPALTTMGGGVQAGAGSATIGGHVSTFPPIGRTAAALKRVIHDGMRVEQALAAVELCRPGGETLATHAAVPAADAAGGLAVRLELTEQTRIRLEALGDRAPHGSSPAPARGGGAP